jgi:hypothetical protein
VPDEEFPWERPSSRAERRHWERYFSKAEKRSLATMTDAEREVFHQEYLREQQRRRRKRK